MKFKINISLLIIIILILSLFAGCKKTPEVLESLNSTESKLEESSLITSYSEINSYESSESINDNEINNPNIIYMDNIILEKNSILVPARIFCEKLGANFTWNSKNETILIQKDGNSILFKIGSRLINYNDGSHYELSNVKPILSTVDQTLTSYVPLEIISNGLNIVTKWNKEEKYIFIDYETKIKKESVLNIQLASKDNVINGKTTFSITTKKNYEKDSEIQFMLLEKGETKGFIIEKGKDITNKYTYIPKIEDNGHKILVAIVYDKNGEYSDGDAIPIEIKVKPEVRLLGIKENDIIKNQAKLSTETNFLPLYVKYEITEINDSGKGKITLTELTDPLGTFTWNPMMNLKKKHHIRAVAYDSKGNPYYSQPTPVIVDKERILTLSGVKENMTIDKEVTLIANRNFDVSETEYLIRDVITGEVSTIAKIPYGGYKWNPSPDDSGKKELFVRVVDRGKSYESKPVKVTVDGSAKIFLEGIGPNQVINKDIKFSFNSNVNLDKIKYIFINPTTNKKYEIIPNEENNEAIYTPPSTEKGSMQVTVQGEYNGKIISSEIIKFKIYHGDFYGPKAIVEKDNFIPLTSELALKTYEDIRMSAALQTAQAILESGWGQSVPVDKYTGTLSHNLFGIKGKGTIGSVISNTWEVYNGVTYRVDDNFRAYNNLEESWKDHKALLLNSKRYEPFTDVMYDYTKGAWAIKRAGYATDPKYPIKLINIIYEYNLFELDKIKI